MQPFKQTIHVTELKKHAILGVMGEDACLFLQGQLSCNMLDFKSKEAKLALYCNRKGRIIASLYVVLREENDYHLILDRSLAEAVLHSLTRVILTSKVIVTWVPTIPLGFMYPVGSKLLHPNIWALPPSQYMTRFFSQIDDLKGETVYDKTDTVFWDFCDINDGIATVDASTTGLFTPHHLNFQRHGAICFNKGCFVGQEIIARTEHLGSPTPPLVHMCYTDEPVPIQSPVYNANGKIQGEIVKSITLPEGTFPEIKDRHHVLVRFKKKTSNTSLYLDAKQMCPLRYANVHA